MEVQWVQKEDEKWGSMLEWCQRYLMLNVAMTYGPWLSESMTCCEKILEKNIDKSFGRMHTLTSLPITSRSSTPTPLDGRELPLLIGFMVPMLGLPLKCGTRFEDLWQWAGCIYRCKKLVRAAVGSWMWHEDVQRHYYEAALSRNARLPLGYSLIARKRTLSFAAPPRWSRRLRWQGDWRALGWLPASGSNRKTLRGTF